MTDFETDIPLSYAKLVVIALSRYTHRGKIQNGLPFWCQLTQVVLEKRPLNRWM